MVIFKKTINTNTQKRTDIVDITLEVQSAIDESEIANGIVNVFSKHSTSAIVINENEIGLLSDFERILNQIAPEGNSYYHNNIDNNADSHIKSLFLGSSETIPISDSALAIGTWQSIFFVELDGPRIRNVEITVIGCYNTF